MVKAEKSLARMNHSLKRLPCSKRLTKQSISIIRKLEGWLIMICKVCKLKKEVNTKKHFNRQSQSKVQFCKTTSQEDDFYSESNYVVVKFTQMM